MSTPAPHDHESHRHVVHGLAVASDLALPELRADGRLVRGPDGSGPDVEVRLRAVPSDPSDPAGAWFHVRDDATAVLRIAGVATFAVRDGRTIDVEPAAGADAAEVRTYLLGSALGVLLHQRGELPLHVSAVVLDGRAWAFTAPSGTGKSTLAAALHLHRRLPLLADDVAVARPAAGDAAVELWPGLPLVKLREDALAGVDARGLAALPEYRGSAKVRLRLGEDAEGAPVPLAGLVLLVRGAADAQVAVERVTGAEAFLVLQSAIYRLALGGRIATVPTVFGRIARLAAQVPCYRMVLPESDEPSSAARAHDAERALRTLPVGASAAAGRGVVSSTSGTKVAVR